MKIKISEIEAVEKELKKVQNNSTARILTAKEIQNRIEMVEKRLEDELCIPKKYRKGCSVILTPSRPHSGGYKYIPHGTFAELVRGADAWFLISCYRKESGTQPNGRNAKITLILTDEALAQIKKQEFDCEE